MSAETTRSYIISSFFIGSGQFDTSIDTGTFCTFGNVSWVNNEGNRSSIAPVQIRFHHYTVEISSNANTVDGAIFTFRVNSNNGNQSITFDQGTVAFTDTTNSDIVAAGIRFSQLYTEGDNTVGWRNSGVLGDVNS